MFDWTETQCSHELPELTLFCIGEPVLPDHKRFHGTESNIQWEVEKLTETLLCGRNLIPLVNECERNHQIGISELSTHSSDLSLPSTPVRWRGWIVEEDIWWYIARCTGRYVSGLQ